MAQLRKQGGFTLVELIVVLLILAVLAAILVPTLTGYIGQANSQKDYDTAAELKQSAQAAVIKQQQQHPNWSYENLNPVASSDKGLTIDGKGEKDYVCDTAGVDSADVDWFWFNVDSTGAVTPVIQTNWLYNPNYKDRRTNGGYPTSVSIKGKVYYQQSDGSWAAAKMDGNTFQTENLEQCDCRNGQVSSERIPNSWTVRSQ